LTDELCLRGRLREVDRLPGRANRAVLSSRRRDDVNVERRVATKQSDQAADRRGSCLGRGVERKGRGVPARLSATDTVAIASWVESPGQSATSAPATATAAVRPQKTRRRRPLERAPAGSRRFSR
jgi:hypothetical protein